MDDNWFEIGSIATLDTPMLAIYRDRVKSNVDTLLNMVQGDASRLRPHIKTHKSPEVCDLLLEVGIKKFKCATIAEAEMLAEHGAPDVLLAYQPVGPKANRLLALAREFPQTLFSCLLDDEHTARHLSDVFKAAEQIIRVYLDLNVGMNRTGIEPSAAAELFAVCQQLPGITVKGLHAYDGHIRDREFAVRQAKCDKAFEPVALLRQELELRSGEALSVVVGGSPTFSVHCKRPDVTCSPGTFIYWDHGYQTILAEQGFKPAALVVTRVISQPTVDTICIDLGHKAIASENPLTNRVYFLNDPLLQPVGHSEEHMVLRVDHKHPHRVGDVLYGVPFHICPTVALYDLAAVVVDQVVVDTWHAPARGRQLKI